MTDNELSIGKRGKKRDFDHLSFPRLRGNASVAHPMLGLWASNLKVRKKILLIDHEPHVTRLVRQALESVGKYSIREEHDTAFAVRAARWFQPDLIMVDLNVASSDGKIVADQLQADRDLCETPLLCLSDFVAERGFLSAGMLSGYSFLAAPVQIEQLLCGVEQILFSK
jgi:two-component system, OmpR family, response regulator